MNDLFANKFIYLNYSIYEINLQFTNFLNRLRILSNVSYKFSFVNLLIYNTGLNHNSQDLQYDRYTMHWQNPYKSLSLIICLAQEICTDPQENVYVEL